MFVQAIAYYIGETARHLATRINKHLEMAKNSRIFVRLHGNENWRALSTENCIESIDPVSSSFRLKLTEAIYIVWKKLSLNKQLKHASKPSLNKQIKHASITITL